MRGGEKIMEKGKKHRRKRIYGLLLLVCMILSACKGESLHGRKTDWMRSDRSLVGHPVVHCKQKNRVRPAVLSCRPHSIIHFFSFVLYFPEGLRWIWTEISPSRRRSFCNSPAYAPDISPHPVQYDSIRGYACAPPVGSIR